jgi:hypothetical protein
MPCPAQHVMAKLGLGKAHLSIIKPWLAGEFREWTIEFQCLSGKSLLEPAQQSTRTVRDSIRSNDETRGPRLSYSYGHMVVAGCKSDRVPLVH